MRRFFESWSPFRLMYAQSFFVTSVRGIGFDPTTVDNCALGVIGFMNAGFGLRFTPVFFRRAVFFLAAPFRAPPFREDFFRAPPFFLVAIEVSPAGGMEGCRGGGAWSVARTN
jgi:hypothetical protein